MNHPKLTLILCFVVLTDASQYSLNHPSRGYLLAARGYSVDLDCQLNYPSAHVYLMQEKTGSDKLLARVPDGVKITQSGQIFTLNNIDNPDRGKYYCKVQSTVLRIERLVPVTYGSRGN